MQARRRVTSVQDITPQLSHQQTVQYLMSFQRMRTKAMLASISKKARSPLLTEHSQRRKRFRLERCLQAKGKLDTNPSLLRQTMTALLPRFPRLISCLKASPHQLRRSQR